MTYEAALITGATSGIGAAFAEVLPAGTALLLTGRRANRLAAAQEQLGRGGRRVETVAADFAAPADRRRLIERAEGFGLDLVICNAGMGRHGAFLELPYSAIRETIDVNIVAPLELLRALLPAMRSRARADGRRAGVIIVASTAAFQSGPSLAAYAGSKAFLLHFGEAFAAELANDPLDVLTLCPSFTRTEFFARAALPPPPAYAVSPQSVAREALAALGRRPIHITGGRHAALAWLDARHPDLSQGLRLLFARNPALAPWRWRRQHQPR